MVFWILVAAFGALLLVVSLWLNKRKHDRGEIRGRLLTAYAAGALSLCVYAVIVATNPGLGSGLDTLLLLPVIGFILVIVREQRRRNEHPR